MTTRVVVLALVAAALAACSSVPSTFGERLEAQSAATAELGDSWNKGDAMIREGREMVSDGQSELSAGQSKIDRGQAMITQGETMRRTAEQTYQERFLPAPSPTAN